MLGSVQKFLFTFDALNVVILLIWLDLMHGKQNNIKVRTAPSACKKYFVMKLLFCNNGGPVRKGLPQLKVESYKCNLFDV